LELSCSTKTTLSPVFSTVCVACEDDKQGQPVAKCTVAADKRRGSKDDECALASANAAVLPPLGPLQKQQRRCVSDGVFESVGIHLFAFFGDAPASMSFCFGCLAGRPRFFGAGLARAT